MSDLINLSTGKAIKEWAQGHRSKVPYSKPMNLQELLALDPASSDSDELLEGQSYYRVEHSLRLSDDWTLVRIVRVLAAHNAEDALGQYIFDSNSRYLATRNGESLAIVIRDDYEYDSQDIMVYKAN